MPTFDLTKVAKIALIVSLIVGALAFVLSSPVIAQAVASIPVLGDVYIRFANAASKYLLFGKRLFNNFFLPGYEWILSGVLLSIGLTWINRFMWSVGLRMYSAFSTEEA